MKNTGTGWSLSDVKAILVKPRSNLFIGLQTHSPQGPCQAHMIFPSASFCIWIRAGAEGSKQSVPRGPHSCRRGQEADQLCSPFLVPAVHPPTELPLGLRSSSSGPVVALPNQTLLAHGFASKRCLHVSRRFAVITGVGWGGGFCLSRFPSGVN